MKKINLWLVSTGMMTGMAHAQALPFIAGAAKVEITPSQSSAHAAGYEIHDPLNVRAIYLGNGQTCAVLVAVDQSNLENRITDDAIPRAAHLLGCPAANFIVTASHTHSGNTGGLAATGDPTFKTVANAIVIAAETAKSRARPARVGYGTTELDLNVNRDLFNGKTWLEGANRAGVSDKTVAVLQFIDQKGAPIGVYFNYAMHPVNYADSGQISADFPGAAAAYIEHRFPGSVALFSQGGGGDQDPLLSEPALTLADLHKGLPDEGASIEAEDGWTRAANRSADQPALPLTPARQAAYQRAVANTAQLVDAMGVILGESAIEAMRNFTPTRFAGGPIVGAQAQFSCPGRDRYDYSIHQGSMPPYKDGAPVTIMVGMLRIGSIYLASVNAEVFADIGIQLKRQAPVNHLLMATLANGRANVDYIYSNEASSHLTFEVLRSRLKSDCAEDKLIATALGLVDKVQ